MNCVILDQFLRNGSRSRKEHACHSLCAGALVSCISRHDTSAAPQRSEANGYGTAVAWSKTPTSPDRF